MKFYFGYLIRLFKNERLVYTFLRTISLASKFIFVIIVNRFMISQDIINYFYINSIVLFFVYLINFDVSLITTRRYYSKKCFKSKLLVKNFHYLFLNLSAIFGCVLILCYFILNVSVELSVIGCFLFAFEYLCKDNERWLVLKGSYIKSSLFLFVRITFPAVIGTVCLYFGGSLPLVLCVNIIFSAISYFLSKKALATTWPSLNISKVESARYLSVCFIWFFKKSIIVFFTTMIVKMIFSMDKQIIKSIGDNLTENASYFYFFSFAYTLVIASEILIFNFDFPKLLKLYATNGSMAELNFKFKKLRLKTFFLIILLYPLIYFFSILSITYIEKYDYLHYKDVMITLLFAMVVFVFFQLNRQYIYIIGRDEVNLKLLLSSLVVEMMVFLFYYQWLMSLNTAFLVSLLLLIFFFISLSLSSLYLIGMRFLSSGDSSAR